MIRLRQGLTVPQSSREIILSSEQPSRAVTDIFVYAVSDKHGVRVTKHLASEKFSALAWSDWFPELITIVEQVYNTTPEHDRGLRDILESACVSHAGELLEN